MPVCIYIYIYTRSDLNLLKETVNKNGQNKDSHKENNENEDCLKHSLTFKNNLSESLRQNQQ